MSRKSFNPDDCIAPLNNFKRAMQWKKEPFGKETIFNAFKECGLPANGYFWKAFLESNILKKVSKGRYIFAFDEPIYIGRLQEIKSTYQKLIRKKKDDEVETPIILSPKTDVQAAIDLLKEKGYKILIPAGILYKEI